MGENQEVEVLSLINSIKRENKIEYVQWVVATIGYLSFVFNYDNNLTSMYISMMLIFISNIIFCLIDINRRSMLLLFHGAIFVFLLGRITADFFIYGKFAISFSYEVSRHILLCLLLTFTFLRIGYIFVDRFRKNNSVSFLNEVQGSPFNIKMKKWSKFLYFFGFFVNLFIVIEMIMYVSQYSYLEFVKDFQSQLPSLMRVVANFRNISIFIFLGTLPSKKECRIPLLFMLLEGIISMGTGDRSNIAMSIMFIVFYYFYRESIAKSSESWVTKKKIIISLLLIPFILAFLSFFVYLREGMSTDGITFTDQLVRFFRSIGNSVNIIGYGKQYEHVLPQDKLYSLGNIYQYIQYNPVTKLLFGMENYTYYTTEYALNGSSFMHTISYFINQNLYLNGHGYGSCYIAEFYVDFGYLGVCIINVLLGGATAFINKIKSKSSLVLGLIFCAFHTMFYIPRGPADYLLTYVFNITSISAIVILLLLGRFNSEIDMVGRRLIKNGQRKG